MGVAPDRVPVPEDRWTRPRRDLVSDGGFRWIDSMPASKPMPVIGARVHEFRVTDHEENAG
jgi:hypothetical protein